MKQSQTEWILTRLKHGPVTAIDALDGCGCFRLAARINDLRQAGYDIQTKTLERSARHPHASIYFPAQ